jgi:hypothetical protein
MKTEREAMLKSMSEPAKPKITSHTPASVLIRDIRKTQNLLYPEDKEFVIRAVNCHEELLELAIECLGQCCAAARDSGLEARLKEAISKAAAQ